MKDTPILILLVCMCILSCSDKSTKPIMADGQIDTKEWQDSKSIAVDGENTIYYKSDSRYYYLAVKSQLPKPLYVDLFISEAGAVKNIHASSQLGERILTDTIWTDYEPKTKWGYTNGWIANTVKFDRVKMRQIQAEDPTKNPYESAFIPYDGIEFQFSKELFNFNEARFRCEIRNMIGPEGFETVVFPKNSKRKQTDTWATLNF